LSTCTEGQQLKFKYEVLKRILEAFFLSTYEVGTIKLSGIISRLQVYEFYNFSKNKEYFVNFNLQSVDVILKMRLQEDLTFIHTHIFLPICPL
jgi:hypothetical protein